jgi:hypothetical protein
MSEIANLKTVYISYSHVDIEWKDRIINQMRSFTNSSIPYNWEFWDDTRIESKQEWLVEITDAIDKASAVLLLVSPSFLQSKIIYELVNKNFIDGVEKLGIPIISIIVHRCNWQEVPFISKSQIFPIDLEPLSHKPEEEVIEEIRNVAKEISSALKILNPLNQTQQIYSSKQSVHKEATESTSPTILEDSEEPGLVPLARLREFDLSPTATKIFARSVRMAMNLSELTPVSTTLLFFSMVEQGADSSEHFGTSNFFANFIQSSAEDKYGEILRKYLGPKGIKESGFGLNLSEMLKKVFESKDSSMTLAVFDTLEKAKQFSEQTTERGQIHVRQLLAVLINKITNSEKIGFQNRLEEMEVSFPLLRDTFFSFVKENHSDNEDIWGKFLFTPAPAQKNRITRLAGYQADDAKGEDDWLQIDDDVNAFAALIASQTVSPPLSIGLFGEWGSGKTFFMRRLRRRVDKLARAAQNSGKMQRDLPFYKRIAQIEFNAWHYVESNLWASLVEHIFENLRVSGEDDEAMIAKLQEHLLKKLNLEKTVEQQATEKARKAQKELADVKTKLTKAKQKLDDDTRTLQSIRATDILATIELPSTMQTEIKQILAELNISRVSDETQSFVGALKEARATLEHGNTLLTPLIKAQDKGKRFLWLIACLIAAPVVGLLIVLFRQYSNQQWITESVATLGGIATLLATGAAWIRNQAGWVSGWINKAESVKQRIDAKIAEKQAELKAEITSVEQQIGISKLQYESALREQESAKQRVAEAEAELKEASSGRLLAKFIQDRVSSDDYRKHLGVLALVRNDFERLSNFIDIENRRLAPPVSLQVSTSKTLPPFMTIEEENQDKDIRINRVVLYIDDLDRCPPNKVVDVLQAVHLLLAFPLFVVVVGVDARWIARSLETRYKELLNNSDSDTDNTNHLIGAATSDDYLEKIFQIPFWLNPMNKDACEKMIDGLLKNSLVKIPVTVTDSSQAISISDLQRETSHTEKTSDKSAVLNGILSEAQSDQSSFQNTLSSESDTSELIDESQDTSENLLNQQHLEIIIEEKEFIGELTSLLGRSPRSLKRFVNTYRLIKAGLSEEELDSFLSKKSGLSDFQIVLFLIAVDTGIPSVSEKLFQSFQKISINSLEMADNSTLLDLNWLLANFKDNNSSDWLRVKSWLENNRSKLEDKQSLKRIGNWIRRVARYSFQSRKI